jgi:dolichol-phosphate mannosyltransferase
LNQLVIIPTYNEKENISEMVHTVMQLASAFHILVVDDGSPDGTAQLVKNLQSKFPGRLYMEERKGKLGLGTAYIHGFKWALERNYAYICEMDADFSHNPNDLARLVSACKEGADVAIGSRYVTGGSIKNWTLDRHIYSRGGSLYTRMITWMPFMDPTAGFICYSRKVLEAINFDAIRFIGYAFQIEMKFVAWKLGFKIKEVPITFVDRKFGSSKMHGGIIKEGVMGVLKIQLDALKGNYKERIQSKSNADFTGSGIDVGSSDVNPVIPNI